MKNFQIKILKNHKNNNEHDHGHVNADDFLPRP